MWPFKQKKKPPEEKKGQREICEKNPPALRPGALTLVNANNIPDHAVCGWVEVNYRSEVIDNTFSPNPVFVEFLHDFIRCEASQDPELQEIARKKLEGRIYIIDDRAPEGSGGSPPPQDVVGTFKVAEGEMKSYHPNDTYEIYNERRGLIRLRGNLHQKLINALMEDRSYPSSKSQAK